MTIKIGKAYIDINTPLVAGSLQTIVYTFEAEHAIDDTGFVKIVFRYAGDFARPQFTNTAEPNYCSISTNANCRIEAIWNPKGHTRPWGKALYLKIMGGFLNKGETFNITFGDKSQGSIGWRIQTFCEKTFEFKTFVDPFATYKFKELANSPTLQIIPGIAHKAVCIAPSQARKEVDYFLCIEDRWGNATGKAIIKHYIFDNAGVCRVEAVDKKTGIKAISNPIKVAENLPELSHWWADFHGQTEETIGSNCIEDYFTYARDYSKLDIVAHQGNDFQVTDEFWEKINQTTKKFYQKNKFVTFPGYEWSGNTPLGGDRNVYHKNEAGPIYRSSHELLLNEYSKYNSAKTATDLFNRLDFLQSFAFAHIGGRYANIDMHDDQIEVAMEIHSAWGTFEWLVEDAFKHGYRIGICANSDGHKCRPGASYPGANKFGSYGGLTCVLAEKLDRVHIFNAMKARHFYATTGNRILLDIELNTVNKQRAIMGDIIESNDKNPILSVNVTGTSPIDYIEIYNGIDIIDKVSPYKNDDLGSSIKIIWSGAKVRGRDRMITWDGGLKLEKNTIKSCTPINFWNPDLQPKQLDSYKISWNSITTGGYSGIILELDKSHHGNCKIKTDQIKSDIDISSIGIKPIIYELGGVNKKLEIYRLPVKEKAKMEFDFSFKLKTLKKNDNPIYIKVIQQDGHMAWSSPIYYIMS